MVPTIPSKRRRQPLTASVTPAKGSETEKRRRLHRATGLTITQMSNLVVPPSVLTPTSTAQSASTGPTMPLTLHIPDVKHEVPKGKKLARRKQAAKKWEATGRLQEPFPQQREISQAYPLKLMRHYPVKAPMEATRVPLIRSPSSSGVTPTSPSPPIWEPSFVKPRIQKSDRVTNLLKAFPKFRVAPTSQQSPKTISQCEADAANLDKNNKATSSEEAKRLAWDCFADRVCIDGQSMTESGLPSSQLQKEAFGMGNKLPEWAKRRTSKFRIEKRKKKVPVS